MSAVLEDWPTLDVVEPMPAVIEAERPVETLPALQSLREHSLAELSAVERGLADLKREHGSTDYNIQTPAGYKLATVRRHAVRLVRYQVPHVVKAKRAELNEIRDAVASEGDRIIAALLEIEQPHDNLITDEDARRKAEQAEKARVEQERKDRHEAAIAMLRSYAARCEGLTSERISSGITQLENQTVGDGFQEYLERATAAKAETLVTMHTLYTRAKEREQEVARLEAQRVENERVAAEQEAERARIAEAAAKVKADAEALQRRIHEQAEREAKAERDAAAVLAAQRAESERLERLAEERRAREEAATVPAFDLVATPEGDRGPMLYAPLREVIPEAAAVLSDKPVADAKARAFVDAISEPAPAEAVDWHARGMDWALADAITNEAGGDWTIHDMARAYAAGAAAAMRRT